MQSIFSDGMTFFGGQPQYAFPQSYAPVQAYQPVPPVQEMRLSISLPMQEYKKGKIPLVPFDPRLCNNGRFDSIDQAMEFIAKHTVLHHGQFKKNLAKQYLYFCRILRFTQGGYVPIGKLTNKDFETAFQRAQRNVKSET